MQIEIISTPLVLEVFGFSGTAPNGDYASTAFKLMDRMWQVVKGHTIPNKGKNIWIYEAGHQVFAGVELLKVTPKPKMLEAKQLSLLNYARFTHVGPYNLIRRTCEAMNQELDRMGLQSVWPLVEIYGHWTNDELKLETEILMALR